MLIYYSKWTQTRDLCVWWKTVLVHFIETNWKHYRDALLNSRPEIKLK